MALSSLSPVPQTIAESTNFEIDKIRGFIADYAGVDVNKVSDEAHFCDDLGLDWLECLELVLRIEDETGIEFSDSDATRIESVGNLLRHIRFVVMNGSHSPTALGLGMLRPLSREDAANQRWKTRRATFNC